MKIQYVEHQINSIKSDIIVHWSSNKCICILKQEKDVESSESITSICFISISDELHSHSHTHTHFNIAFQVQFALMQQNGLLKCTHTETDNAQTLEA